jgi:hypothetical protein
MNQRTGLAATLSIFAAIGSFIATCAGHPLWGLVAAIVAIPLGVLGFVLAASPRVSGGILSIVAMVLGAVGAIFAVLGIAGVVLF